MDFGFVLFLLVAFIAVVFLIEGAYLLWNDVRGPEVQRIERRLRALSAGEHGDRAFRLLKRKSAEEMSAIERAILSIPRVSSLDRLIQQAGVDFSVMQFILLTALLGSVGLLAGLLLRMPWWTVLAITLALGLFPLLFLLRKRSVRLAKIDRQLPDALDLIGRALRAGHAFPSALQMVGEESSEPIATEFRITAEELNYGVDQHDAFMNMATRVPSDDLRYFVIAVLLQRETGGNLAELLSNISALVRSRYQLLAKVRVLAAEGRLSAYILVSLPFVLGALLSLLNPGHMSVLWTDPGGLRMIAGALILMVIGVLWMWRIIKIRV